MKDFIMSNDVNRYMFFTSSVYMVKNTDFLKPVTTVSKKYLSKLEKKKNEIYPVSMTDNFFNEPDIEKFSSYILDLSWEILKTQGYQMNNKRTHFTEMWTQEHGKHSMMEQHTHKFGSQIIGFYFLETPKNCSKLLIHDPRPAKTIIGLDESDTAVASEASDVINFTPEPGLMVLTNGWLPHSFSRHENSKPISFVHFNVSVNEVQNQNNVSLAEVI